MSKDSAPRQISVAEMAPHVHSFKIGENKVDKISAWLIKWIEANLDARRIKPYDRLPSKADLAFHTSVSVPGITRLIRAIPNLANVYCTEWDVNTGVNPINKFYFAPVKNADSVDFYIRCGDNYVGKNVKAKNWYTK